jgi:hypothetical protein
MSDDGFKTSRSALGEVVVDGQNYYGIIAEMVLSGYIESSTIRGGIIQIGLQSDGTYAFEVREDGSVTMNGGGNIDGYVREEDFQDIKNAITIISDVEPTSAIEGQMWLDTSRDSYALMVYTNGSWTYFSQQDGSKIYISRPDEYNPGDIWILAEGETYGIYGAGSILKADENLNWIDAISSITGTITNVKESFEWDETGIKVMKKTIHSPSEKTINPFYVHIDSTRMGFHSVDYNENGEETGDVEVVHVGNNSSTIQNATFQGSSGTKFENSASFEQQINMYQPSTTTGFIWKIESNGSLSLAVSI